MATWCQKSRKFVTRACHSGGVLWQATLLGAPHAVGTSWVTRSSGSGIPRTRYAKSYLRLLQHFRLPALIRSLWIWRYHLPIPVGPWSGANLRTQLHEVTATIAKCPVLSNSTRGRNERERWFSKNKNNDITNTFAARCALGWGGAATLPENVRGDMLVVLHVVEFVCNKSTRPRSQNTPALTPEFMESDLSSVARQQGEGEPNVEVSCSSCPT